MFFEVEDPGFGWFKLRAAPNVRELVCITKGILAKGTVDGTFFYATVHLVPIFSGSPPSTYHELKGSTTNTHGITAVNNSNAPVSNRRAISEEC